MNNDTEPEQLLHSIQRRPSQILLIQSLHPVLICALYSYLSTCGEYLSLCFIRSVHSGDKSDQGPFHSTSLAHGLRICTSLCPSTSLTCSKRGWTCYFSRIQTQKKFTESEKRPELLVPPKHVNIQKLVKMERILLKW